MLDKKASPRSRGFAISLIPFCLSILLFLTRLFYVSASSGSFISPTLLFQCHYAFFFFFLRSLCWNFSSQSTFYCTIQNQSCFATVLNLVSSQHFWVLFNCEEVSSEMTFHVQTTDLWKAICTQPGPRTCERRVKSCVSETSFQSWILFNNSETKGPVCKGEVQATQRCAHADGNLKATAVQKMSTMCLLLDFDRLAPSPASCRVNESWAQAGNYNIPQGKTDALQGLNQRYRE